MCNCYHITFWQRPPSLDGDGARCAACGNPLCAPSIEGAVGVELPLHADCAIFLGVHLIADAQTLKERDGWAVRPPYGGGEL